MENATALLLTLSPSGEEHLGRRKSIADALEARSGFGRLIKELRVESTRVKMLAAAVRSRAS